MRGLPGAQKNTVSEQWASPQCAILKAACRTGIRFQEQENPKISQIWGRLQSCHSELLSPCGFLRLCPVARWDYLVSKTKLRRAFLPQIGNSKECVANSVYGKASSWNLCWGRHVLSCLPSPRPSSLHHTSVQEQKASAFL